MTQHAWRAHARTAWERIHREALAAGDARRAKYAVGVLSLVQGEKVSDKSGSGPQVRDNKHRGD